MKKVLIVAGALRVGGAEWVCRNIGFYADPNEFQIDYLVFGDSVGTYEAELLKKGCRIWHLPSPGSGYRQFYTDVKKLIQENKYSVVHCHTMFNSGLVLRIAKSCGVPIRIAHSHSTRSPERRGRAQELYEKAMRRWILKDATHYVGCGRAAGEWLFGETVFREKGILLLNGIELDRFAYDPAARQRIRKEHGWENCFVIGHAGHLATVKNQKFLLELMPELLKRRPETRLILLGEGTDRPMLKQTVHRLGLEKVVTIPGNVNNVNEYLSAMDVFAFPSLYEGMPLAILEVQANGLPCVISDRVPKDVFLTDLLHGLPLEDAAPWADVLLTAKREAPDRYVPKLRAEGFDTVSVMEKIYALYRSTATVSLSFDDGRGDTAAVVDTLLRPSGIPAAICIATGYVDRTCPAEQLPTQKPPLTVAEIQRLSADPLVEIAAHGDMHQNTEEDFYRGEEKLRAWLKLSEDAPLGFASPGSKVEPMYFRPHETDGLGGRAAYMRTGLRIASKRPLRVLCRKLGRVLHLPLLYRIAYHDTIMTECDGKLIYSVPIMRDITVRQVLFLVRDCIRQRGALVLMLHSVLEDVSGEDNWTWERARLETLCRELKKLEQEGKLTLCTTMTQYRLLQNRM